jgi:hypothetical protein
MAEAADKPTSTLDPREWASFDEAFVRLKACVGSRDLALHDLLRDLRTPGRLGSAERILPYSDTWRPYRIKEALCRILEPSYWAAAFELRDVIGHSDRVRVEPSTGSFLDGRHYFFVRRRDLDRLYPPANTNLQEEATGSKPGSASAWIDELWPDDDEWRLLSAKDVYKAIAKEAEKRRLKKWPSYRAVANEVRRRRR